MATTNTNKTAAAKTTQIQDQDNCVCVFGATGSQGGSVVEALLKDGKWRVRAITRKADSAEAKALKDRGCEVVECDMTGTKGGLTDCMNGCCAAFLMTDFWDKSMMMKETEMGKKLVDAAKAAGVKHVLWSTLPNVEKESNGKYDVPHFTDKAKVDDYIREMQSKTPKAFQHVTFIRPAFYYQNFDNFFPPKKEGDTWVFTIPNIPQLIAFDVNETGCGAVCALNSPAKWDMKYIDYYGDTGSTEDYVKTWGKTCGKKCKLNAPTLEEFGKGSWEGAKEMAQMFGWFKDYTYYGKNTDRKSGQEASKDGLCTWEDYCKKTMKTQTAE